MTVVDHDNLVAGGPKSRPSQTTLNDGITLIRAASG
jgi:hypothetical protein